MAKQGQHNKDSRDSDVSRGRNNPDKSMTITTGSYKKPETYEEQARRSEDTNRQAQAAKPDWKEDTHVEIQDDGGLRARSGDLGSGRSGSDSNASRRTRG